MRTIRQPLTALLVAAGLTFASCAGDGDDDADTTVSPTPAPAGSAAADEPDVTTEPVDNGAAAPTSENAPPTDEAPTTDADEPSEPTNDAPPTSEAPTTDEAPTTEAPPVTDAAPAPAEVGGRAFAEAVEPAAAFDGNPFPDLVVDDVRRGTKANLANVLPSDRPVLLWAWAPH